MSIKRLWKESASLIILARSSANMFTWNPSNYTVRSAFSEPVFSISNMEHTFPGIDTTAPSRLLVPRSSVLPGRSDRECGSCRRLDQILQEIRRQRERSGFADDKEAQRPSIHLPARRKYRNKQAITLY